MRTFPNLTFKHRSIEMGELCLRCVGARIETTVGGGATVRHGQTVSIGSSTAWLDVL